MTTPNWNRMIFARSMNLPPGWVGAWLWELLFDENLSRKLFVRLAELYPESAHVAEVDLIERPDHEVRVRGLLT